MGYYTRKDIPFQFALVANLPKPTLPGADQTPPHQTPGRKPQVP